jgi:hypothetical protein
VHANVGDAVQDLVSGSLFSSSFLPEISRIHFPSKVIPGVVHVFDGGASIDIHMSF